MRCNPGSATKSFFATALTTKHFADLNIEPKEGYSFDLTDLDTSKEGKRDINVTIANMLATKGIDIKGKTVLVSGSGNVAQYTMEKLLQLGAKPVTCSDSDGYIYDPDGIDREKLDYIMELKNVERGRIKEYAEKYGVKYVEGAKPW